ncbi:MAG: choice-of-anchor D domain-containing protein [Bacteroidales bacterium]|nr:choice-of-anchor D domain-containing protein [Bacteroidales bacterium]
MKKRRLFSVVVLSMILLVALAPVHALEVSPSSCNFGDVEVGTSISTIITITNIDPFPVSIDHIEMIGSGDFSATSSISLPLILEFGETVDIIVVFTPSAEGEFSADLVIQNGEQYFVVLFGTGVSSQPPPISIQDILSFYDASVEAGTLYGVGPNNSARINKLKVFRKMLVETGYLLDEGNYEGACDKLNNADKRCDDYRIPPDFVQGPALAELSTLIAEFMGVLGCAQFSAKKSAPTSERLTATMSDKLFLAQNTPNPFHQTTTITYSLHKDAHAKLIIYNTLGQVIHVLVDEYKNNGIYSVIWDAGYHTSGIYYYRLESEGSTVLKKMFLLK